MAEQNLKDKTVKGVAWSSIDNVAQFAVSFIVGIVLARLLTPDDYGLEYINLYNQYVEEGMLSQTMTVDGIHLYPYAYKAWYDLLKA